MISPNELRIGNHVLIDQNLRQVSMINCDDGFADVPSIGFAQADESAGYASCSSDRVQSCPLNEGLLQSLGFVFHPHFHFWQKITTSGDKRSEMNIDLDMNIIDFMRRPIVRKLSSLHQLQNIYFFLHGQELSLLPATPAVFKRAAALPA
jgi:hypothetical protein